MDDEDMRAIAEALGYSPAGSLQLDNYCASDVAGHRELAQLATSLALRYGGVIDIGGVDVHQHVPNATGVYRLSTGRFLLGPRAFSEWSKHSAFHLEK
jgi:hypothetical protein